MSLQFNGAAKTGAKVAERSHEAANELLVAFNQIKVGRVFGTYWSVNDGLTFFNVLGEGQKALLVGYFLKKMI